jgi:hypothetical protein
MSDPTPRTRTNVTSSQYEAWDGTKRNDTVLAEFFGRGPNGGCNFDYNCDSEAGEDCAVGDALGKHQGLTLDYCFRLNDVPFLWDALCGVSLPVTEKAQVVLKSC